MKKAELDKECQKLKNAAKRLSEKFNKLNVLIEQKQFAKSKRESNPTTEAMISDVSSSTRYRRRKETKNMLEYIHGGANAALHGAWDFLTSSTSYQQLEKFLVDFKKGKFIEKVQGKFTNVIEKSDAALKKALAVKYATYMSRRKYDLMCKIQKSIFSNDGDGVAKPISYGEHELDLKTAVISHHRVDQLAKEIDIGEIHTIAGYSGVARTVSTLVTMITDLHLSVPSLQSDLLWFNDIENHFIVEFSDDGAPESRETTMSIGSLTLWNFGAKVRSRQFHYPLHTVSAEEKDQICASLWKQHTEEMMLIESNVINIKGKKVTFEFQPSADQSWQIWANNVLPASATYPSPFANVHKGDLKVIGGSIGLTSKEKWKPPTYDQRKKEIVQMEKFRDSLPSNLSSEAKHKKELQFMAEKGIRQIGEPRIGIFSDRQRPDPLHLEINSWQHLLNLIYLEAVRRGRFEEFNETLLNSKSNGGCGLKFVAKLIREHYEVVSNRMKSLAIRLIGAQAIALARYCYRLVDAMESANESNAELISRLALSKICEKLRDIGSIINRVKTSTDNVDKIQSLCQLYFNLYVLFFPQQTNITVWTLGYVIPYHAKNMYDNFKIGYGILTMQGKESKHSAIKYELKMCSNRSKASDKSGKWYQLMRASFIRNFYLPYHLPSLSSNYHSHFQSRIPPTEEDFNYCYCSRLLQPSQDICFVCEKSINVLNDAEVGKLSDELLKSFKPIACNQCGERFSDNLTLKSHSKDHDSNKPPQSRVVPANLNLKQLKEELSARNLSISGNKEILRRRLEGALAVKR